MKMLFIQSIFFSKETKGAFIFASPIEEWIQKKQKAKLDSSLFSSAMTKPRETRGVPVNAPFSHPLYHVSGGQRFVKLQWQASFWIGNRSLQ